MPAHLLLGAVTLGPLPLGFRFLVLRASRSGRQRSLCPDAKGWMQPGDLRRPPGIGGVASGPGLCPHLQEVRRSQRVMRPAGPGPPSGDCKTGNTHFWRGHGGKQTADGVRGPPLCVPRADTLWPLFPGVCAEGEEFRPSHLQRCWGWGRAARLLSILQVPGL